MAPLSIPCTWRSFADANLLIGVSMVNEGPPKNPHPPPDEDIVEVEPISEVGPDRQVPRLPPLQRGGSVYQNNTDIDSDIVIAKGSPNAQDYLLSAKDGK